MITIDSVQIFIITHNRSDLIKETIKSLLNQTAGVKEITVLDNESTDNTEQVVKSYADKGVKYVKTFGFLGNFYKAKELANKKYVMLFHDDDILHPDYLRNALKILNTEKNIAALYTRYTEFFNNDSPKYFPKLKKQYHLFKTQKDFAVYMYFIEVIAYATAIYRTNLFKKIELEYDKFNKFNDWPFMVKFAEYGEVALFNDPNAYFVRRHSGQDTWTYTNIPSYEQIVNWDKFFYDIFFANEDANLRKIYEEKSAYFMNGKYNAFLPPDAKKDFSLEDLHKLANNKGIKTEFINYEIKSKLYKNFCKFISIKSLKSLNPIVELKKSNIL